MANLRWSEAPNHYESLAVAWRAVLNALGSERTYEECLATLGLGALVVAQRSVSLGEWPNVARDGRLLVAAEAEGVELRALHPPEAAAGLGDSEEFAQHFRDSYLPLIRTALRNEQLVLAWRGWPAPREGLWGVLTHELNGMLFGHSLWHDGQPMPLLGAAHQVYIVVTRRAAAGGNGSAAQFRRVARQAVEMWRNGWTASDAVVSGSAALEAWRGALTAENAASEAFRYHSQLAQILGANRRYLGLWLRRVAGALTETEVALAAKWANACDHVSELLVPFENAEVARALLSEAAGAGRFAEAVARVEALEDGVMRELAERVEM